MVAKVFFSIYYLNYNKNGIIFHREIEKIKIQDIQIHTLLKYYILIQDGLWALGAHLRMTVYMVEGKRSTYSNPDFMLAKVTEC